MARHDYGSRAGWWDLFDHTPRCIYLWLEVSETGNMFLFRCPRDPRTMRFAIGNIAHPDESPLLRTSPNTIEEGHYIIYKRGNSISAHPERICWMICSDKKIRKFVATWPTLVSTEFKRRSRSPSQTCTPSPSNTPSRVSLRVSILQLPCILWLRNAEYRHPHCGAHER